MPKRPDNTALLLFFSAGIILAFCCYSLPFLILLYVIPVVAVFLIKSVRLQTLVLLAGSVVFFMWNHDHFMIRRSVEKISGAEVFMTGKIVNAEKYSERSSLLIRSSQVEISGTGHDIRTYFTAVISRTDIEEGDNVSIRGRLRSFPEPVNRYQTDQRMKAVTGYTAGEIEDAVIVSAEKSGDLFYAAVSKLSEKARSVFSRRLSYSSGGFLSAIMTGDKSSLEKERIKEFADSGTIHLLAVSGLHVGFVVMLLSMLNAVINPGRKIFLAVCTAVLVFYAAFTGAGPSVVRAVLMALILMYSRPMKRKVKALDIIGTAGIISLTYDPNQIFMPGFILSFLSVISIVLIHNPVYEKMKMLIRTENRFAVKMFEGLLLSLSVTLGLLPVTLFYFGKYNFLSVLSNLIMIPLTAAAFTSGAVLLVTDRIPVAADFFADATELLVSLILRTAAGTARVGMFTFHKQTDLPVMLSAILVLTAVFYLRNMKYRTVLVTLSSIIILISALSYHSGPGLYIFGTGKGTAALLQNRGENILFADGMSIRDAADIVRPHIVRSGIKEIDYLVTGDNWNETENLVRYLQVPVRNIASDKDHTYLPGKYGLIDMRLSGGSLRTALTELSTLSDGSYMISTGGKVFELKKIGSVKGREVQL